MSDFDERIARYRTRAQECLAIADRIGDETLRAQYMDVAESYLKLAESELGRAAGGHVIVRDTTCRLFGYHLFLADAGGFALDHMFGF